MSGDDHPERVTSPEEELYFKAGEERPDPPPAETDDKEIRPPDCAVPADPVCGRRCVPRRSRSVRG